MNILLTSVGRRSYLVEYFKDAFKNIGLVHASNLIQTHTLQVADKSVITPAIYSEEYIPFLLNYCKENKIGAVISLFDIDLQILANNKELFKLQGVEVIVSNPEVIEICNDKWKTYRFLVENEFSTPKTFISLELAKSALEQEQITYPVIVKPRWGMGSVAVYKAENQAELEVFYAKVKREIAKTYLKYESKQDINRSILIQQFISGAEYGIEIVNNLKAEYVTTMAKEKIAMRAGETDQAEIIHDERLSNLGCMLSNSLAHVANLDVDVLEEDGNLFILEMNARFGGQYPFSHLAGANLPKQIRYWLQENKTDMNLFELSNIRACKEITLREMV